MEKIQGNDGTQVIVFKLRPKLKKDMLLSNEELHYRLFLKEVRSKFRAISRDRAIIDVFLGCSGFFLFVWVLLMLLYHFLGYSLLQPLYIGSAFTYMVSMTVFLVFSPIVSNKSRRMEAEIQKRIREENKEELPRNQYWELNKDSLLLHYQPRETPEIIQNENKQE